MAPAPGEKLIVVVTEFPYCTDRLPLEGTTLNDAGGATCSDAFAEALSVPLVAWKESVYVPSTTPDAAVSSSACPAAVKEKGDEGETVIPEGRPESVTVAVPSKPFSGCRETVTAPEVPGETEMLDGLRLIVKEGDAGAGVGMEFDPPPQPLSNRIPVKMETVSSVGGVRMLLPPQRPYGQL